MGDVILITGGAGYIGSHTTRRLLEGGRRVVVVDDLSTGHREVMTLFSRVYGSDRFCFEEVDLLDREGLREVFDRYTILGVIDFAAKSLVGESQEHPRRYFDTNVVGFRNLVTAAGQIPIVKSSTAATYGDSDPEDIPLTEGYQDACIRKGRFSESQLMPARVDFDTLLGWYSQEISAENPEFELEEEDVAFLKIPTNVYGITKVMDERILSKAAGRGRLKSISLRYFNAVGADRSRLLGEDHDPETHLIPLVLRVALGQQERVTVFGDDYETADGTAVRDYVSVGDLVEAHVLCLEDLLEGGESRTYNLGTSNGYSVRQIIETAREVTGHEIPERVGERRSGDPAVLVADASRVREALGWAAQDSLEEVIASAWHWHRLNPEGFRVVREERFNPFWGRWVNMAAHRSERPWRGETEALDTAGGAAYDPDCYLCPGNERASGEVNPGYTDLWSFPNDFPALVLDGYPARAQLGPYAARTSQGVCEVMNFSPDHSRRLSTMEVSEIVQVVDEWAETYGRLGGVEEIKYPLIFENRGAVMGNSQPHPHGQVYAYGEIPDLMVVPQLRMFEAYRKEAGGACFVCDANRVEIEDERRVLALSDHFAAYVPFAAQFPYDVALVPLSHAASLLELGAAARYDLACTVKQVLGGLDALFGVPYHYSLALIQAPTDGEDYGFHMQVHITSLLRAPNIRKHVVGADIFGNIINPSDPNVTAEEIRYAMRRQR